LPLAESGPLQDPKPLGGSRATEHVQNGLQGRPVGVAVRIGVLAAGTLVLLSASARDCGPWRTVVHEFALPRCPDTTFSPAQSIEWPPYSLKAGGPEGRYCRRAFARGGDLSYALSDSGRFVVDFLVRVARTGPSCKLSTVYTFRSQGAHSDDSVRAELDPLVAIAAENLLRGSGAVPVMPATQVLERSEWDQREWCSDRN
jgi:hypothetical protein